MLRLDHATRRDWEAAVEAVPELVVEESPAIDVLDTEGGNIPAAALRLALYWKTRRVVFGEERWLLPLTITVHGALDAEDLAFMLSGVFDFVPLTTPGGVMLNTCVVVVCKE